MIKKAYKFLILIIIATIFISLPAANTSTFAAADGSAEIAIESATGTVLHEKNAEAKLPMASTTKIMTAYMIAEESDLSQIITVPEEAVGVEGSSIYLKKDERISVKDLLYGLMLRSGNDAACALAIYHSGSVEKFVEAMNKKAADLGAASTHFSNPSGLPDENHYTTAKDLAHIARCAMQNESFRQVVSTKSYSGDYRNFVNKNKFLTRFEGANGVKTGYTKKAGRCLVSSAEKNGFEVICVVLNCYDMYERSEKIIDSCYLNFSTLQIDTDTEFICGNRLCSTKENCTLIVKNNKDIEFKILPYEKIEGDAVGKIEIYCENCLIFSHDLFTIN